LDDQKEDKCIQWYQQKKPDLVITSAIIFTVALCILILLQCMGSVPPWFLRFRLDLMLWKFVTVCDNTEVHMQIWYFHPHYMSLTGSRRPYFDVPLL
jgi:hypothetical protein